MNIACPECGSTDIRSSYSRSFGESVGKVFGFFQFRCRDCDARFSGQIWDISNLFWAKCPRCYHMDLSTWDPEHYRCPTSWLLLMRLGARCVRCEYCRHNFLSYRPTKHKFIRKQKTAGTGEATKKSTLR